MTEQTPVLESALEKRFPEAVKADERKGYEGFIVETGKLIEVATALRDEMGYDFLSSLTAVDYIDDDGLGTNTLALTGADATSFEIVGSEPARVGPVPG